MRYSRLFAAGLAIIVGLFELSGLSGPSSAQTAGAADASEIKPLPLRLKCKPDALPDPFKDKLAGPDLPSGIIPVGKEDRVKILNSDLPCQERVNPAGLEDAGLQNLQRGFDFYSWRTFVALNSPADGKTTIDRSQADTPTRWEDMDNFKQLLDVMLPAKMPRPKWPTDRKGMEDEKVRLMPEECRALSKQMPDRMVVKMIEESFNEPFKTGPLIDQQGHYAIFDILMNRQMFDYIKDNRLYSKAGQMSAANSGLLVDFPPGADKPPGADPSPTLGAFMLKVSWKILVPSEIQ